MNLRESQLIKVWQYQLLDSTGLVTEGGEPIEIVYPGRLNDGRGADFRDAVLTTGQGLITGDIEVHVNSSGWQEHGHQRDALYNRVILHVVMWHNVRGRTSLQNGKEIPVLALHKYIKSPVERHTESAYATNGLTIPCHKVGQRLATGDIAESLDGAGEERFLARAVRLQTDLTRMEAGQSLYQGIMGALGYSRNQIPFLELARRLPLQTLESMTRDNVSDEDCLACLQAMLLGMAGLLPSQCRDGYRENNLDDRWRDRLEKLWAACGHSGGMRADAWHLFKVRPNNSPIQRLAAMSYLMLRYRQQGILMAAVELIREAPNRRGRRRLEEGLLVTADGYRAGHYAFGAGSSVRSLTLLGGGRAAEIIVNVLLPFVFAWSRINHQPELEKKAFCLYCSYPKLTPNSIERHMMAQLGLNRSLVNSARRQQGLLHIYKSLCIQGRCHGCRLSQLETGNHV